MQILRFLTRYSTALLVLGIVVSVASGLVYTGLIAMINGAIEGGLADVGARAWVFGALILLFPITRTASQLLLAYIGQRALADLRVRLADRVLKAPLRSLEELGIPRLLASLTDDVQRISNAIRGLPLFIMHAAIVLGCLVYMGWLSPILFGGVLVFVVLAVVSYQYGILKALRFIGFARETQDRLFAHFRALTEGIKELKLNLARRTRFLNHHLKPTTDDYQRYQVAAAARYAVAGSWVNALLFMLTGLLLFLAPQVMPVGMTTVVQMILTLMFMAISLDVMSQAFPTIGSAEVALRKVHKLGFSLDRAAVEETADTLQPLVPDWRRIVLEGAVHSYQGENEDEKFVLGPIDLSLERGQIVFVIGGNGSGKTTLAKLLTGLYAPERGRILLDPEPVTDENRERYRQNFSAVFSDFHLFERLLGAEGPALDERAQSYLEKLQLERKVSVEDGALSTVEELSQGQRKRLALLMAYLEDRPVYVFDEWAADQDPEFKDVFYLKLLSELKANGKTVFVISHDDRYYDVADRVIKLDYGQVEFDGAALELPARWQRVGAGRVAR